MTDVEVIRDRAVADKISELQGLLEVWAKETNILQPGERIVFSLRVEGVPLAVHDTEEGLWDMPAVQFFNPKRLVSHGVYYATAVRIYNSIRNEEFDHKRKSPPDESLKTMRSFLAKYTKRALRRFGNMGPKSVNEMERVLKEVGMVLREDDY